MSIAIVGTGFSGLAVGWSLIQRGLKVVFYENPRCEGASPIASGLLHPYAGEKCKRSWKASEGLAATIGLLNSVEDFLQCSITDRSGVIRIATMPEQIENLTFHAALFKDVEKMDENTFFISTGLTVQAQKYVEGLKALCRSHGAAFIQQEIHALSDLQEYSRVVIAAGSKATQFFPELSPKFSTIKGQLIQFRHEHPLKLPVLGKGYLIKSLSDDTFILGSTYERNYSQETPDLEFATKDLFPHLKLLGIDRTPTDIIAVRSGIRANRIGHYYPIACQMRKNVWMMGGMGSRGLLYHAYVGEQLAHAIREDADSLADPELSVIL